ncbi:hypothetical protein LCGC14_0648990 [marine sediment metagenome]|uniref:Ribosome recycling factor domain-containing protein n=1 Tax=marine sediment metagenome TaxID=412755 RepID=A0A0F9RGL2_9ZZZZ|nr:ribosome recycling factor [Actinomycetota bacterium]
MDSSQIEAQAKQRMDKALAVVTEELKGIRTGRASAGLLDRVKVDYYGTPTPIKQLANINVPESQLITISPWDKSTIPAIEKAVQTSDLGITPSNDGNIIRLSMPPLTEERRKELSKVVHNQGEESKVAIRNIRRDILEDFKQMKKDGELTEDDLFREQESIQKVTDKHTQKVDELVKNKQNEIMTV